MRIFLPDKALKFVFVRFFYPGKHRRQRFHIRLIRQFFPDWEWQSLGFRRKKFSFLSYFNFTRIFVFPKIQNFFEFTFKNNKKMAKFI